MNISTFNYFALFFATFALVGVLTPIARKIAIKTDIVDRPNAAHKTHKEPVPYLGGVAIIIGILAVSYATAIFKNFTSENLILLTTVMAPATVLGLVGLWDDIKNLSPSFRFAIQTIAGIFTAWILIANDTIGNPTGSKALDAIITIIWVVGICNSINFFDNLDGGATGAIAISAAATFIIAHNEAQFFIAALAAVTVGATLGFLNWNKSPARIYMGDAGALFLGVLIATLTIRLHPTAETKLTSLAIPVLLLAVPIMDTSVAVTSRIRRGVSPFQGGHDHLSHRLMRSGLHRKSAVLTLWSLSGLFAVAAIFVPKVGKPAELIIVAAATIIWFALFFRFLNLKDQ
jgi:UDP-GlcNAc:undecaprenyl-phosphate GlcNAc-1-phosphate transferase